MIHMGTTAVVMVCSPSLLIWMQECMCPLAIVVSPSAITLAILPSMHVELYMVSILHLEIEWMLISDLLASNLVMQEVS